MCVSHFETDLYGLWISSRTKFIISGCISDINFTNTGLEIGILIIATNKDNDKL